MTLLIRVLEDAINKPIKRVRSVILGPSMAAITVMSSHIEGRVDGHKNFDSFAEGDTSFPDHFVAAKFAKKKKEGKKGNRGEGRK